MAERTVKGRTVVIVIAALVIAAVVAAAALSDVRRSILESNPSPKKCRYRSSSVRLVSNRLLRHDLPMVVLTPAALLTVLSDGT